jgi:hypothetical protein
MGKLDKIFKFATAVSSTVVTYYWLKPLWEYIWVKPIDVHLAYGTGLWMTFVALIVWGTTYKVWTIKS